MIDFVLCLELSSTFQTENSDLISKLEISLGYYNTMHQASDDLTVNP